MEKFIENPADRLIHGMPKHRGIDFKIQSTAMQSLYKTKFVILRRLVSSLLLLMKIPLRIKLLFLLSTFLVQCKSYRWCMHVGFLVFTEHDRSIVFFCFPEKKFLHSISPDIVEIEITLAECVALQLKKNVARYNLRA